MITLNRLAYTAAALLVVFFIWTEYATCNRDRTRLAEATRLQAETDSLQLVLSESETRMQDLRTNYLREMAIASTRQVVAGRRTDSMSKLLSFSQTRIKHLLNERVGIMEGDMDHDSYVDVITGKRVSLLDNCDSAFALLPVLDAQITGYREENEGLKDLMGYEIKIREDALAIERRHSDTLELRATLLGKLATQAVSLSKPRNKIFFTTTLITDLTGVGYGGGFTLVTKKDKVWSAKIGVMNRQFFYQADFSWLLSLKKK